MLEFMRMSQIVSMPNACRDQMCPCREEPCLLDSLVTHSVRSRPLKLHGALAQKLYHARWQLFELNTPETMAVCHGQPCDIAAT